MKFFKIKNLIQIYTKTHQIAPFLKIFSGGACPRTPLAKRMASPCAACRFATCEFPNLKKKFLAPPSQILRTPLHKVGFLAHRPVTRTNIDYKINVVLSNKCTGTIGDSKPACTSPYDGTEPVIHL